jgi:hypothetical protein
VWGMGRGVKCVACVMWGVGVGWGVGGGDARLYNFKFAASIIFH